MVHTAASVEWTVVDTEVEALQLEWTWINEFNPRFNVMFRDDKSYPYLAITMNDEVPRAFITRGKRRKGSATSAPSGRCGRSGTLSTSSSRPSRCARALPASTGGPSARAPLPARLHRQVRGPVCGQYQHRGPP